MNRYLLSGSIAALLLASQTTLAMPPSVPMSVPEGAKPILDNKTITNFRQGVHLFTDKYHSRFEAMKRGGSQFSLKNEYSAQSPKAFSYGGSTDYVVRGGALSKAGEPRTLRSVKDNTVVLSTPGIQSTLSVKFDAYDVSGKRIVSYLRSANNRPSKRADRMSDEVRFPSGSVAYVPTMQMQKTEVVIPTTDIMTGQKTLDQFIKTFSGKIPNCLRYERHSASQPYAIRFSRIGNQKGEIEIFEAKRRSAVCEAEGSAVAKGSYQIQTINGTRVMALTFPKHLDSRDVGIKESERQAMQLAFVEVTSPSKKVLPGRIVHAKRDFHDFQFRFNDTAAEAILKASR
ncbi:MAG: hypothetical protein IKV42_02070 [Burkholderiaceae bacterium]|nr:hypothetical protein [Burkholderiaceae bacterium]